MCAWRRPTNPTEVLRKDAAPLIHPPTILCPVAQHSQLHRANTDPLWIRARETSSSPLTLFGTPAEANPDLDFCLRRHHGGANCSGLSSLLATSVPERIRPVLIIFSLFLRRLLFIATI